MSGRGPREPLGPNRARGGFTLVELLIATLLTVLVLVGVWLIHSGGWRNMLLTQKKLGAIRGAHLLFEILHRDLKGARSVLVAPRVPDPATGKPGPTIFLIDGKEYVWDPRTGILIIAGERWVLGLFEEIQLEQHPRGLVKVRIVSLAEEAAQAGPTGVDGFGGGGRTVVESWVTVDTLRTREAYPSVVEENRASHGYCEGGEPIDY